MVVAAFFSQPPAVPPPPAPLGPIGVTLFSSFGCMLLGYLAVRTGLLEAAARKGIASLYAQLVFPTMVFVGVADIDLNTIDRGMLLVILLSKVPAATVLLSFSPSSTICSSGIVCVRTALTMLLWSGNCR